MKYEAISIIALKGLIIAEAQFELLDLMQEGEFLFHNDFKTHFRITDGACEGLLIFCFMDREYFSFR